MNYNKYDYIGWLLIFLLFLFSVLLIVSKARKISYSGVDEDCPEEVFEFHKNDCLESSKESSNNRR